MKPRPNLLWLALLTAALNSFGQGSLIYVFDQQSSTNETPFPGAGVVIQEFVPLGQSFTPSLSAVGFIRLKFNDYWPGNHRGASLYVNLRTNSIAGPILRSSDTVSLSDGFAGTVNFLFADEVAVAPGSVYFMEPVVQSGDKWNIHAGEYQYPGGTTISRGQPLPGSDLWFREGIIIPEPSGVLLVLVGGSLAIWRGRACKGSARPPPLSP